MKINVDEFKDVLMKGTVNYCIQTLNINYDKETNKIWSKMATVDRSAVSVLNIDNTVFKDMTDNVSLYFGDIRTDVKPLLDLLDGEVGVEIKDDYIKLNKQVKVMFKDPSVVTSFKHKKLDEYTDWFVELDIDDDFINKFKNIKKVGSRFKKIYMIVEDNTLFIETTDRTDPYSNAIKYKLCNVNYRDAVFCFRYEYFVNVMAAIASNYNDGFKLKIIGLEDRDESAAILNITNEDEKYYIISTLE